MSQNPQNVTNLQTEEIQKYMVAALRLSQIANIFVNFSNQEVIQRHSTKIFEELEKELAEIQTGLPEVSETFVTVN